MALDFLRGSENWFTRGVLVLLALTFIFGFGFSLTHFGSINKVSQGTAAEVNGEKISLMDFYRARENLYRQFQQQQEGVELPEGALNYIGFTALNQLIELRLMVQKAKELGFRVTDKELSESIRTNPALQIDDQFIGAEAYRNFIEQQFKVSIGEFERNYRDELLAEKVKNFMLDTVKVTDEELFNSFKMQNEKADVYFVAFSPESYIGSYSPTEEEVKKYYDDHKADFKASEQRTIRYFTISPDVLEKKVNVSDEEIKAYYDAYPDEFKTDGSLKPLSEVKEEIAGKLRRQRSGLMRSDLLKNIQADLKDESIDKIAEKNGAEKVKESRKLSENERSEDFPAPIVNSAFSIKKGEKTLVPVAGNIWVIEVADVIAPKERSFEEVKEDVTQSLKLAKAKEAARAGAEEALKKAKAAGGVEKVQEPINVEETGYFSRVESLPKIDSDEARTDSFFLDSQNPVAGKVYEAQGKFYIISFKDKQPVSVEEFESKKEDLRENEINQRRTALYLDWVKKLRKESKTIVNDKLFNMPGAPAQQG